MDIPWVWGASFTDFGSRSVGPCIYALPAPAAPPPPPPPPHSVCCGRVSSDRTFSAQSATLGCVPMAIPYPAVAGRCIGVPIFGKVEVPRPATRLTRGDCSIKSSYVPPKPPVLDDRKTIAPKTATVLSRPPRVPLAVSQVAIVPSQDAKKPEGAQQNGFSVPVAVHNTASGRLRRVTRRVSGSRTPQPYQRRRRIHGPLDQHVLQVPGQEQVTSTFPRNLTWHRNDLAEDYEEDVMKCQLEIERRYLRTRSYLSSHPSVNQRTRAILVDWLIQVQSYLELSSETLYQSISLVDRILEVRCVPVHRIQLLAITALLIVSKLEEKRPTETTDLLQLTLNSYTRAELLSLERQVLSVLKFELSCADQGTFLNYFLHLACNDQDTMVTDCSGFLLGIVLVEAWPMETRPSLLAASALYGALMTIHNALAATAVITLMPPYFNLEEEAIVATSLRMLEALENRRHSPFQGTENKYSSRSRHNGLAQHPRLSPENLRSVVEKVRMRLVELRGENTVVRDRLGGESGDAKEKFESVCNVRDKLERSVRVEASLLERSLDFDFVLDLAETNDGVREKMMDVDA